jgi:hypothetical protein
MFSGMIMFERSNVCGGRLLVISGITKQCMVLVKLLSTELKRISAD